MPYQKNPVCETPENKDLKVWRYMDFTKFMAMLENKALFFFRLSKFADPLEGFLTNAMVNEFRGIPEGLTDEQTKKKREIGELNLSMLRMGRDHLIISSWHINDFESVAMWELYLNRGEGVAIQTTIGRLIEAFSKTQENVYIGQVYYVDYEKDKFPWNNLFYLALHKRKSFEHEVRAIVMDVQVNIPGKLIAVDLDILIDNIYIAPNAPVWIHALVTKMISKYGLNKKVVHSGLEQGPLY
jgi:hypothetical protein